MGSGAVSDFGFTGHSFDRATGNDLTWWRGYDPNLGRWLRKDPIDLAGGPNLYAYVDESPVDLTDPDGTHACDGRDPNWKSNKHQTCLTKCFLAAAVCYYIKKYTADFCGTLYTNCITACGPGPN